MLYAIMYTSYQNDSCLYIAVIFLLLVTNTDPHVVGHLLFLTKTVLQLAQFKKKRRHFFISKKHTFSNNLFSKGARCKS